MKSVSEWLIILLLLVLADALRADSILDIDHACFRANDSLGYVEIYAAIHQSGLRYKEVGDSLIADFRVVLDILQSNSVVLSDTFHAVDQRQSAEQIDGRGNFYVHAFRFIMKPGSYYLQASLFHWEDEPLTVVEDTLYVPIYLLKDCALSDIELGTNLQVGDSTQKSVYDKNGIRVIPNATGFYGSELPILYYYAEVYGVDFDPSLPDSHVVIRRVLGAETELPVRPDDRKLRKTTGSSVVIADGFPIATLRTGTYYLEIEVQSPRTGKVVVGRKKFWTYRPEDFAAGRMPPETHYESRATDMGPDYLEIVDLDSAQQWMRYILTRDEYRQLARLTPEGKRKFIMEFWQKREQSNPNAGNEYFARLVEANRRYTYLRRPGWKTDRGRVFVLYGEPDRIQRNYAQPGTVDHEIWEYNQLEGGVIFVFADRQGFGDLDLVHSTKRGEVYDPNWRTKLRSSDQSPVPNDPTSPGRRYE